MIRLYQFPPVWGRNVSPFTLKLETWLRLAQLPYDIVPVRNPGVGPKGKLPYIIDDDGSWVADSGLIISHLKRTRQIDPDHVLTERERAASLCLQRLFEEHFYFILAYSRWCDSRGWEAVRSAFFDFLPPGIRGAAAALVRRRVRRILHLQGLGRHHQRELYAMAREDLRAVSVQLGSRRYFFGDGPTTIDAIAYGFLANLLFVPVETDLKKIAQGHDNLRRFCERLAVGLGDEL